MQYFVCMHLRAHSWKKRPMAFARFPEAQDTQKVRKSFLNYIVLKMYYIYAFMFI